MTRFLNTEQTNRNYINENIQKTKPESFWVNLFCFKMMTCKEHSQQTAYPKKHLENGKFLKKKDFKYESLLHCSLYFHWSLWSFSMINLNLYYTFDSKIFFHFYYSISWEVISEFKYKKNCKAWKIFWWP